MKKSVIVPRKNEAGKKLSVTGTEKYVNYIIESFCAHFQMTLSNFYSNYTVDTVDIVVT
jgi:hypothetical protein